MRQVNIRTYVPHVRPFITAHSGVLCKGERIRENPSENPHALHSVPVSAPPHPRCLLQDVLRAENRVLLKGINGVLESLSLLQIPTTGGDDEDDEGAVAAYAALNMRTQAHAHMTWKPSLASSSLS